MKRRIYGNFHFKGSCFESLWRWKDQQFLKFFGLEIFSCTALTLFISRCYHQSSVFNTCTCTSKAILCLCLYSFLRPLLLNSLLASWRNETSLKEQKYGNGNWNGSFVWESADDLLYSVFINQNAWCQQSSSFQSNGLNLCCDMPTFWEECCIF